MKYTPRLIPLTFLFSLLLPSVSQAENIDDSFEIRLGTFLVARSSTVMSASTPRLIGAKIDLQDDLGMQSQTNSVRLDGHYRFNDAHKLEFSYYNLRNDANRTIDKQLEFNDTVYSAGAKIDAYLNLNIFKVDYAYSFYHNDKVELALAAGVHFTEVKTGLTGSAIKNGQELVNTGENVSFLAPLPIIGFRLDYAVTPRFNIGGAFDYFALTTGDFEGSFSDFLITADYQLFDNWGVGLGFNLTSLDLSLQRTAQFELQQDITGFLAYVSYKY